jgi:hypothetical protein
MIVIGTTICCGREQDTRASHPRSVSMNLCRLTSIILNSEAPLAAADGHPNRGCVPGTRRDRAPARRLARAAQWHQV